MHEPGKILDPNALTVVVVGRPEGVQATRTISDDG